MVFLVSSVMASYYPALTHCLDHELWYPPAPCSFCPHTSTHYTVCCYREYLPSSSSSPLHVDGLPGFIANRSMNITASSVRACSLRGRGREGGSRHPRYPPKICMGRYIGGFVAWASMVGPPCRRLGDAPPGSLCHLRSRCTPDVVVEGGTAGLTPRL